MLKNIDETVTHPKGGNHLPERLQLVIGKLMGNYS